MPWLAILSGVGVFLLGLALAMRLAQIAVLRSRPPVAHDAPLPVSILKPIKGIDENLRENLESFFRLDHPDYEIVFGAREEDDPGLLLAREVAAAHPLVAARFVVSDADTVPNPKVNNLANMLPVATHELILISDSNVVVDPDYLRELSAYLEEEGVGLVTSPFTGVAGRGAGGALMEYHLNTFVMGGTATLDRILGITCTVGKSMLLRRADLESIGGFAHLGRFLAEDQVLGEDLVAAGRRIRLSHQPVRNPLGRLSLGEFAHRHLRWAMIRRWMSPWGYFGEQLLNPVFTVGIGAALIATWASLLVFAGTWLTASALGFWAERALGVRRALWAYPPLELGRSVTIAVLWPVPYFFSRISWRGNRFRLGRRTRLSPM